MGPQLRVSAQRASGGSTAARRLSFRARCRPLVAVCALALAAGGCGGAGHAQRRATPPAPAPSAGYSSRVRSAWLHTCEAAANRAAKARARCECTLAYLEAHVAQATLQAGEQAVLRGEASEPEWMLNAVAACLNT